MKPQENPVTATKRHLIPVSESELVQLIRVFRKFAEKFPEEKE